MMKLRGKPLTPVQAGLFTLTGFLSPLVLFLSVYIPYQMHKDPGAVQYWLTERGLLFGILILASAAGTFLQGWLHQKLTPAEQERFIQLHIYTLDA